jgi:hypothetical protein
LNTPKSLTVEAAVARIVNLGYIPTGFSLLEMLSAFQEEAEVEYHNAQLEILPVDQLEILRIRVDVCTARHTFARLLIHHLSEEIGNQESTIAVVTNNSSMEPLLSLSSVSDWASELYGIDIQDEIVPAQGAERVVESDRNVRWEDITIKIHEGYKIAYSNRGGGIKWSGFLNIGLMGKRKNGPNYLGGILIGLSNDRKYPTGNIPSGSEKTAISKLRRALEKLTGITSDPFYQFSKGDGWKPRFKLIDDQKNADERAEKEAKHVSFDETMDSGMEDDDSAQD